jgi:hypothetical protein
MVEYSFAQSPYREDIGHKEVKLQAFLILEKFYLLLYNAYKR